MPATLNIPLASSKGSFLITPNVGLMVWTIVVFVISLLILRRAVFPRIGEALDNRSKSIEGEIDSAHELRQEADKILAEYRERLKEVAAEHDAPDRLGEQIGQFADAVNENRELAVFFFSPYFSTKEKQEALGRILDGASPILMNFLELLIENHRMPVIFR